MFEYSLENLPNGSVSVTFQNEGDVDLSILRWNSPFSVNESDCLVIKDGTQEIPYIGSKSKHLFDSDVSVFVLKAKQQVSFVIPIKRLYYVKSGIDYTIDLRMDFIQNIVSDGNIVQSLDDFNLKSKMPPLHGEVLHTRFQGVDRGFGLIEDYNEDYVESNQETPGKCPVRICWGGAPGRNIGKAWCRTVGTLPGLYYSLPICSQSIQGTKRFRVEQLTTTLSVNHWRIKVSNNALYKRWFGTHSTENESIVQRTINVSKPRDACKNCFFSAGRYSSVVSKDTIASTSSHTGSSTIGMTLYPIFWNLPFSGIDSQIGTLVHEYSHGYASTLDYNNTYGVQKCLTLARTNPSKAIINADNYEFYVEETLGQVTSPPIGLIE